MSRALFRSRDTFVVGLLWCGLALFAFRVGAQLLQALRPVAWLPAFAAWQSGTIPYPALLSSQVILLCVMTVVTIRAGRGGITSRPRLGAMLLSLGASYCAFMVFRLAASVTFARGAPFLGATLPALFHVVLSVWMLALGRHLVCSSSPDSASPAAPRFSHWLVYPLVMLAALWLYYWLQSLGVNLWLRTYLPVALGAAAIALLERIQPCREEWHPEASELRHDLLFLGFVQMLLPKALTFLVAVTLLDWLQRRGFALNTLWPQGWPPLAQALLMVLCADFLRYWLHRASHEWVPWLWRFHAVHHSPHKLNWVNVGRFHPLEKSVQFLCDAAPFLLLGVSEEVLALYFVLYAVNGFFQHCNIELRLGWLNFVVSGPELHRWHHSWEPRESNKNYGNNLIVWDLVFGSYFLPPDRRVELLGLRNRNYPRHFLGQLRAPFVNGLDQAEK